jgi:iron-sulfur cluster assembly accessory protein
MITVTSRVKEVVRMLAGDQQGSQTPALRLGVAPDARHPGPARMRYVIDLECGPPQPLDQVFGDEEMAVVVAQEHLEYLDGLELDVEVEQGQPRFLFRNPHAAHSCRCGQTFSAD